MNRQEILELTGADEWDLIKDTFGGMTVEEIETRMLEWFNWDDTAELSQAIYAELN